MFDCVVIYPRIYKLSSSMTRPMCKFDIVSPHERSSYATRNPSRVHSSYIFPGRTWTKLQHQMYKTLFYGGFFFSFFRNSGNTLADRVFFSTYATRTHAYIRTHDLFAIRLNLRTMVIRSREGLLPEPCLRHITLRR